MPVVHHSSKLSVVAVCLSIAAAGSSTAGAQCINSARGVVLSSPIAPTPVRTAVANVLGYELHVLNAGTSELQIDSLEVLDVTNGAAERRLQHDTRTELATHATRVGERGTKPKVLSPGVRTVVFYWIRLDTLAPLPRAIAHRVALHSREGCAFSLQGDTLPVNGQTQRVIAAPVAPGDWWMGLGPSNDAEHRRALVRVGTDTMPHLAQRFAIDWVMIGPDNEYMRGGGKRNEDYYGYRKPVLAATPGRVVFTNDGVPDNEPGENSRAVPMTATTVIGNMVVVELEPHVFATYAHLVPASLRVRQGQRVQTGDTLGLIGNSGNSDAPHLHFHITTAPDSSMAALRGEGIPFLLDRFSVIGHDPEREAVKAIMTPKGSHVHTMPVEGDVIRVKK